MSDLAQHPPAGDPTRLPLDMGGENGECHTMVSNDLIRTHPHSIPSHSIPAHPSSIHSHTIAFPSHFISSHPIPSPSHPIPPHLIASQVLDGPLYTRPVTVDWDPADELTAQKGMKPNERWWTVRVRTCA
jgi:hypothetical protein